MKFHEQIDFAEEKFDKAFGLMGMDYDNPGYHTQVPSGSFVHPTRENFDYAVVLLAAEEDAARTARARQVLLQLLDLQDTNPVHRTFGIWPWFAEEPLEKMSPPDWNWADFCGSRIAEILLTSRERIAGDSELLHRLETALFRAAVSIFRRNVTPDYTNISIMGAGVCAAAGELLNQSWLVDYARQRLLAAVEHAQYHGGFSEYNSPNYTTLAIEELERIAWLVRDDDVRHSAETLRHVAWKIVADHFHPATGQWAGPHARSYQDRVRPSLARFLSQRTGLNIASVVVEERAEKKWSSFELNVPVLPCPPEFVSAFRMSVPEAEERRHSFIRNGSDNTSVRGTTWLAPDICLGTVNRGDFWTQRRPLLAYWRTEEDPAVVLRLRFLKDGRDFASVLVRNDQSGLRVLSAINFATDMGDWHLMLDRPASGLFTCSDLRLRYEILGKGVFSRRISDSLYCLGAGQWRACIHLAEGVFDTGAVYGEYGSNADLNEDEPAAWVDAVCFHGPPRSLSLSDISRVRVGAALELVRAGEGEEEFSMKCANGLKWQENSAENVLQWGNLAVRVPHGAEKYFKV